MVRRYHPTLMDYVVIAINPALIMVLIGSLVYFLLEMFYQGQYPERLHFCLTLFIFAAVLIARISMEEGWDHAAPFGAALAVAIMLAMHKFVSYEGRGYEALGWAINYVLIGIIWWCAIQLTWDCTLIDESQDASGEGLLQTAGFDRDVEESTAASNNAESPAKAQSKTVDDAAETAQKVSPNRDFNDAMAWSVEKQTVKKPAADKDKAKRTEEKSWWARFIERRRRPHAPGIWIVYFSLAALPIFGFGQAFIPVSNAGSRRYAFVLLCVYVATALGLLMTTSFLGLRRYLRQRRLEMPVAMAGTWLATGAVLIVALLVLTMLLPRPNSEYAISQLPVSMGSTEHDSSQLAAGREGTRDEQAKSGNGERSRPELEKSNSDDQEHGSGRDTSRVSKSGSSTEAQPKSGSGKSDASEEAQSKSGGGKAGDEKSGDSQSDKSQAQESNQGGSKNQSESKDNQSGGERHASKENQSSQAQSDQSQGKQAGEANQSQTESPSNPVRMPDLSLTFEGLSTIFKFIFYGAIVLIALWWSWTHRDQLLALLQAFLTGWRDLWGLFGRRSGPQQQVVPTPPQHKSFYDYTDPFASGTVAQHSPAELIRYSFEAFEAWGRDQGWPRDADQTAHEFARQVAGHVAEIAKPARALADLYSRAAYAPGTLPTASTEHLRELWQTMRERQSVGI